MKWIVYVVIVLAILVALYGCDEQPPLLAEASQVAEEDNGDLAAAAAAAGMMLDVLGYPKVDSTTPADIDFDD